MVADGQPLMVMNKKMKIFLKKIKMGDSFATIEGTFYYMNNEEEFKTCIPKGGLGCCFQAILDAAQLKLRKINRILDTINDSRIDNDQNDTNDKNDKQKDYISGKFKAVDCRGNHYDISIENGMIFCNGEHMSILEHYLIEPFIEVKWQDIKALLEKV